MATRNSLERVDSCSHMGADSPYTPSSSSRRTSARNECVTTVEPVVLNQKWTVSVEQPSKNQPGACLRSSVFRDAALPDACWQLCLYPGGKREENANNVSLFLKMSATSPTKEVLVKAEYRFYFLDDNDEAKFSNVNIGEFHAKPPKGGHSWGLRNIPRLKVQNSIRNDKSLVISCSIELIPDVTKVPCKKVPLAPSVPRSYLDIPKAYVDAELEMLKSFEGADIEVVAGSHHDMGFCESFTVHSYKLIAHSGVFRAMLSNQEFTESKARRIEISDFSPLAVRIMLEFLYSGTIVTSMEVEDAAEVMQIADKYDLAELKKTCEQQLLGRLNHQNVLECVCWAASFGAKVLQEACVDYIVSTRQKVMAQPEWRVFLQNNMQLGNMILEKMVTAGDICPPMKKSRT